MCLFAYQHTGHKINQKNPKRSRHPNPQALKFDNTRRQVMPKRILFSTGCFDSMPNHQVNGTWVETRTGGHGSPISGTTWAHMAVSSHVGRRSFASCQYGHLPNTHIMAYTGHSTEKQLLAYIGKPQAEVSKLSIEKLMSNGWI